MGTVGSAPSVAAGVNAVADDAVRALLSLGYTQVEADRAVRAVVDGDSKSDVSVIVRAALARLASS